MSASTSVGRRAQTKGVSMHPHELEDVRTIGIKSHLVSALLGRSPGGYRTPFDLAEQAGIIEAALAERLKPSVGMRHAFVHASAPLNLDRGAGAVPEAIDAHQADVRAVARFLVGR